MNVALWAEIRRLAEIERLSQRAIARRLHCTRRTIQKALAALTPPGTTRCPCGSILDPYRTRIAALIGQHPELSAVRVHEEIARGPDGFRGSVRLLRRYLSSVRPPRGRVYQEVHYEPGEAMQVDWGDCGSIRIGQTTRRVSVFVAVLCYSRMPAYATTPTAIRCRPSSCANRSPSAPAIRSCVCCTTERKSPVTCAATRKG